MLLLKRRRPALTTPLFESGARVARLDGGGSALQIDAGSPSFAGSSVGVGPAFSGGGLARFRGQAVPDLSGAFSLEVLCAITAAPSLAGFFSVGYDDGLSAGSGRGLIAFGGGSNRNIYFWGSAADLASGIDWRIDGLPQHVFVTSGGAGTPMVFYRDGLPIASGTTPSIIARPIIGAASVPYFQIGDTRAGWDSTPTGVIARTAYYTRALSAAEVFARTFAKPRRIWVPVASAVVSHPSTGALSADASSVSGTAVHLTLHTSTGALAAQASSVAGAALHPHTTSGALSADSASVSGSAAHLTLHASTGTLAAGDSSVAGAALHPHTTTGALASQDAAVSGAATHLTLHASSGALASEAATVAGDAEHAADGVFDAAGSLSAHAAAVVGAAQRFALHTTSGALAAGDSAIAGSAAHQAAHDAEGAIAAGPATVAGSAAHITTHDSTGDLAADAAAVAGVAFHSSAGVADPAAVWNYQLSNGLTAEQTLVAIYARLVLNTPPVDVNVQWVNDILIQGSGAPPDHWRPS